MTASGLLLPTYSSFVEPWQQSFDIALQFLCLHEVVNASILYVPYLMW